MTATIATRCDFEKDFDTPAFFSRHEILSDIRKPSDSLTSQIGLESLCDLLNCLNNAVLAGADFMQAVRQIEMHTAGSDIAEFVVRISVQEGIASEQVWVTVLDWLIDRLQNTVTPCRQAARLLREQLRTVCCKSK